MSYSVLVCDDSVVARKQVIRCLNGMLDVDICQASNGREALEVLASKQIDLVCLDLTMPILDGIGVLEAIKQQVIETYVVVISADIQDEMKTRVARLGALAFLEKPVKPESLQETLSRFGIR
ncbi:response regulator [Pseudoalteromonas sp. DL2-H2.2]|uniref:response regulator n=1 Tax=Pseudoalteromonas sp. DL2-H2.2 TaxID=2908889 RepID=UPI001F1DF426|nr:response regulator [Pseudoalteromonas sp. DL2-H2.2]MCF2908617.1 response regulator [Pseudoalteromonas sp. DL2-H2.2]